MSLFVLASKDGWVNIMYNGLDAVAVDQQVGVGWGQGRGQQGRDTVSLGAQLSKMASAGPTAPVSPAISRGPPLIIPA